jgi:hypothetical protein
MFSDTDAESSVVASFYGISVVDTVTCVLEFEVLSLDDATLRLRRRTTEPVIALFAYDTSDPTSYDALEQYLRASLPLLPLPRLVDSGPCVLRPAMVLGLQADRRSAGCDMRAAHRAATWGLAYAQASACADDGLVAAVETAVRMARVTAIEGAGHVHKIGSTERVRPPCRCVLL